jgi:hypothetical protein
MEALLMDPASRELDIIAIQDPHQYKNKFATCCPSASPFWPVYPADKHARVCFMVNKRLDLTAWTTDFSGDFLATLQLETKGSYIQIVNCYALPQNSLPSLDASPIYQVPDLLARRNEIVLLGDFNLHHPRWGGTRVLYPEAQAHELVEMVDARGLSLLLPQGTPTYHERGNTTIDLVFATQGLEQQVLSCNVVQAMAHGSDHLPIKTVFACDTQHQVVQEKWAWKKMDVQAVKAAAQLIWTPKDLTSRRDINNYAQYLIDFSIEVASRTTPRTKPSSHAKGWWDENIAEAVNRLRQAQRSRLAP